MPTSISLASLLLGTMGCECRLCLQNGGIDTEEDYKYKAKEEQCRVDKENRHVVSIDGYEDVPPNDEGALLKVPACLLVYCPACPLTFLLHRGPSYAPATGFGICMLETMLRAGCLITSATWTIFYVLSVSALWPLL